MRVVLAVGSSLIAATAIYLGAGSAAGQAEGTPLTKSEYFNASVHFFEEQAPTDRLYYKMAVVEFPQKRCAALAHRYDNRLAAILTEATEIVPPPEIASIHAALLQAGQRNVIGISRAAKRARHGKLVCGEDIEHPVKNELADRIYRVYQRSGFDQALQQLRDLGYIPSGE
jgi:hypothetical protein